MTTIKERVNIVHNLKIDLCQEEEITTNMVAQAEGPAIKVARGSDKQQTEESQTTVNKPAAKDHSLSTSREINLVTATRQLIKKKIESFMIKSRSK